jgi:2-methylisocitrate lyase-like PEP mutase family enzyme
MNKAALNVYQTLRHDGTQRAAVEGMQTRAELYEYSVITHTKQARRAVRQGTRIGSRLRQRPQQVSII